MVSVLALAISNIFLTVRLIQQADCPRTPMPLQLINHYSTENQTTMPRSQIGPNIANETNLKDTHKYPFANIDFRLGRWDTSRTYKIFDYVVIGNKFAQVSASYRICLATQSSVDRIHSIVELVQQWTGPISLATFAQEDVELCFLQLYIHYLRSCHAEVRDRLSIHLVLRGDRLPANGHAPLETIDDSKDQNNCSLSPKEFLKEILNSGQCADYKMRARLKVPYPQNHLRNVARKACQSGYVFMTDVDIVPSNNFADSLNEFLKIANCQFSKCAYVVPTYELDLNVQFPKSKSEIVDLSKKGLARPFHQKIFIYNQLATNFTRWEETIEKNNKTHVSHVVDKYEFAYEPFYIAPDTVPLHDERFVGYGFTRNTQVYETHMAGFTYIVLSPVFTCHWGFQSENSRPAWRERQNSLNRNLFAGFKREVSAKYPKLPNKLSKNGR